MLQQILSRPAKTRIWICLCLLFIYTSASAGDIKAIRINGFDSKWCEMGTFQKPMQASMRRALSKAKRRAKSKAKENKEVIYIDIDPASGDQFIFINSILQYEKAYEPIVISNPGTILVNN